MRNILLTTPEQRESEDPSIELNPKMLEQWINDLPDNDVIETVAQIDRALSAHNEMKILTSNRIKLLEVYSAAFSTVFKCYDEMRIAQLKIPSQQKRKLAKDIMWLYIKLSHGYKIVVKNSVNIPKSARNFHDIILATFRSLEFTVTSLVYSYRFGLDLPPLVYLELHQLYAFAEWSDISEKRVKEASGYAKQPTIASYYKLALLFICLEPIRFEPIKMELIFLALQEFSHHCKLSNKKPKTSSAFIYYFKLNENNVPNIFSTKNKTEENEWGRYLNIENCMNEINAWVETNKSENNFINEYELEILPDLVAFLAEKKPVIVENEEILPIRSSVDLMMGLPSVKRLLITDSVSLNAECIEWTIQQESERSCILTNQLSKVEGELSLGDFVAIVNQDEERGVITIKNMAFIHRLQHTEYEQILLEIDFIAGEGSPFIYIMLDDDGKAKDSNYFNGIFITDDTQSSSKSAIIIDRNHYQESQEYSIIKYGKASIVRAQQPLYQTIKYCVLGVDADEDEGQGSVTLNIKNTAA